MAVMDRMPVTTPSKGMAISQVIICIAIAFSSRTDCRIDAQIHTHSSKENYTRRRRAGNGGASTWLNDNPEPLGFAEVVIQGKFLREFGHLTANLLEFQRIRPLFKCFRNPSCNNAHITFLHAAGRESGRSDTNTAWFHWRIGVVGDRVLVHRD